MVKYKVKIKSPLPPPLPCRLHGFFFFSAGYTGIQII